MQQEVLVILHSSFAYNQLNKIREEETVHFMQQEKMEEACASFLLRELLPESFYPDPHQKISFSQIHPGFYFLQQESDELHSEIEKSSSIDPHNFLRTFCYN